MVWYFLNNSNCDMNLLFTEAHYAYEYFCLLLENHMARHLRTISWNFSASYKWRICTLWKFSCYFMKQIKVSCLLEMNSFSIYLPNLQTTHQNNFLFLRVNRTTVFIRCIYICRSFRMHFTLDFINLSNASSYVWY